MTTDGSLRSAANATRIAFIANGLAFASWAPIIPFAKANTGVDEAALGLLLLCLGIGSVISMPITGWLCARHGTRPMILISAMIMACALPFLAYLVEYWALAMTLLIFGASIGTCHETPTSARSHCAFPLRRREYSWRHPMSRSRPRKSTGRSQAPNMLQGRPKTAGRRP